MRFDFAQPVSRQIAVDSLRADVYFPISFTVFFFFFNDTAPTEIYTLSLHDALPILPRAASSAGGRVEGRAEGRARRERERGTATELGRHPGLTARLRPVAHGAEFRERIGPRVRARNADEADEGAVAEADPLHELHRRVGLRILRLRLDLVGLQVVEPQHVGADDADVLEIAQAGK